jgi:serine/threonine protein kinase
MNMDLGTVPAVRERARPRPLRLRSVSLNEAGLLVTPVSVQQTFPFDLPDSDDDESLWPSALSDIPESSSSSSASSSAPAAAFSSASASSPLSGWTSPSGLSSAPSSASRPLFDGVETERELAAGHGGFSRLHLCWQTATGERAVCKSAVAGSLAAAMLENEQHALAQPWARHHAHIVRMLQTAPGLTILEYAPHGDLQSWLTEAPAPAPVRLYARQVLLALQHIHAHGFAHGDLAPSNVLVFAPDLVKLADFGLTVERGHAMLGRGRIQYCAPELARGQPVTPASDMWAFACMLVEMAAGAPLFDADHAEHLELLLGIQRAADDTPDHPAALVQDALGALKPRILAQDGGAELLSLAEACLRVSPAARCTAQQALASPYITAPE